MLINQLRWRGIPIWPPLWTEGKPTGSEHGLLKNVEILPLNNLIRIDAIYAGGSISGLIIASEEYQTSLYNMLNENIGKSLVEVGNLEIKLSGHSDRSPMPEEAKVHVATCSLMVARLEEVGNGP